MENQKMTTKEILIGIMKNIDNLVFAVDSLTEAVQELGGKTFLNADDFVIEFEDGDEDDSDDDEDDWGGDDDDDDWGDDSDDDEWEDFDEDLPEMGNTDEEDLLLEATI